MKFKHKVSPGKNTVHDVPQETTLGPILFLIYLNDITKNLKNCKLSLFADDTMLYIVGNDIDVMCSLLNEDFDLLDDWLNDNQLKININKSSYMIFGREYTLRSLNYERVIIRVDNQVLQKLNSVKYLGIILDENLNFKLYADHLTKKIAQKIQYISRISNKIDMKTRYLLFRSIVLPHLDYCTSLLFNLKSNIITRLQIVLNRGMRMVLRCGRRTPIRSMLEALNLMTVRQRIYFKTLDFIYKIEHKMLPDYLSEKIRYVSEVHQYHTRNQNSFFVDTFSTELTMGSTLIRGLICYNKLPNMLRNCNKYVTFRKLLISYVKEQYF